MSWGESEDVEAFDSGYDDGDQDSGARGEPHAPDLAAYSIHSALVMIRG
jgi:hypothetical protein